MAVLKDLIVHGRSRFVNGAQFNTINAESIGANEGIFNKLIATNLEAETATIDDLTAQNATVVGLLDVQGQLHSNSWTNSNIATIDGSFYITPTVSVKTGTFTYTSASNGTITLSAGSNYSFGIDAGVWTANSLVMVTGQVASGEAMKPLGTIRGKLSSASTSTIIIVGPFTDASGNACTTLTEIGSDSSAKDAKDLKVSLYQTYANSGLNPIGIYMSSGGYVSASVQGQNNSFIDIYNGGNKTTTAITNTGSFAKPVLRIGNLTNLGTTGGQSITGYGIYTSNGYFEGVVTAKKGYIGGTSGWTIDTTNIHSPSNRATWNTNADGIWIAADVIAGGPQTGTDGDTYEAVDPRWYIKANGDAKFGELTYINGTLTVPAAKITGELTAASIDAQNIIAGTLDVKALTGEKIDINLLPDAVLNSELEGDIEYAKTHADNFIANDTNGITLHRPGSGDGLRLTDQVEIIRNGRAVATYGESAIIGEINSFHIQIDSTKLSFLSNNNANSEVGYFDGEKLYVKNSLSFGNFVFYQRANNHFTLKLID